MIEHVVPGFLVSVVVIAVVLLIAHLLVRTDGGNFLNIIRAEYWVPSLSLFQFLVWTIVIAFSYVWISVIRLLEDGVSFSTEIPPNLYLLLGISVAVPLVSVGYTKSAYKPDTPAKPPDPLPPFGMMLKQKGKIALNRFQMFLWTIISIVLYLSVVVGAVTEAGVDVATLSLPDIDPTLLYLMGLSQTGYLAGRVVGEEKTPAKEKPAGEAKAAPPETTEAPPEPVEATGELPKRPRKRMPESVRRFLVDDQGHSLAEQERLEIAIDSAEIQGLSRFYLVGDGFYYLIDRGQIRGTGKGSQVDIMRHISDAKEEIGEAEVVKI